MCCGKGRQQLMQTSGMAGRTRPATAVARPAAPPLARSSTAILQYQYVGRTGLTVVSPDHRQTVSLRPAGSGAIGGSPRPPVAGADA